MFQDQQEGNHSVVGIKVFAKVVVRAHLAGEDGVFLSHPILNKGVPALGDDRFGAVLFANLHGGPNHARIEDDLVVSAVLGQQHVGQQSSNVSPGNELALFIEKRAAVGIGVPNCGQVE